MLLNENNSSTGPLLCNPTARLQHIHITFDDPNQRQPKQLCIHINPLKLRILCRKVFQSIHSSIVANKQIKLGPTIIIVTIGYKRHSILNILILERFCCYFLLLSIPPHLMLLTVVSSPYHHQLNHSFHLNTIYSAYNIHRPSRDWLSVLFLLCVAPLTATCTC